MLTDAAIRAAKPADRPIKLADGGGMYLLVRPHGSRYWRLDYRHNGKRGTLAFGVYPTVSLADASEKRRQAKAMLESGVNPAVQRKLEKVAARASAANTFKAVALEYLDKLTRDGRAPATLTKKRWLLDFVIADLGSRPIAESPRRSYWPVCAESRPGAGTRLPAACVPTAARFSASVSPLAVPSTTSRPTCVARSQHRSRRTARLS